MTKKELHDQILELVKNIVIHIITKKHNLNRETGFHMRPVYTTMMK